MAKEPERFNYMMLDRLRQDCNYYLNYGGRSERVLWAGSVPAQIAEMKRLHDSFAESDKPEWLTYEQILEFERLMTE